MQKDSLTPSLIRQHYYSRNTIIYSVLIILLLIFMGFFAVDRYQDYSFKKETMIKMEENYNGLLAQENKIREEDIEMNKAHAGIMENVDEAFKDTFPDSEKYTNLVRELDQFFQKINSSSNPAVITTIRVEKAAQDKNSSYKVLPFTVNMNATKSNFDKFLKYVYESGDFKTKKRLIDVKSFTLTMPDERSGAGKALMLTIKMETYVQ